MSKEINLLPLPRRRQLARRFFEHALRRFTSSLWLGLAVMTAAAVVVVVALTVTTGILFPSVGGKLEEAVVDYRVETRATSDRNALIAEMQKQDEARLFWTTYLVDLFQVLPAGTNLTSMSAKRESRQWVIEGVTAARSTLIVLENKLKTLTWAKSVAAPASNLLERLAPEFRFTIGL